MDARHSCPSTRLSLLKQIRECDNADAWKVFVDLYLPVIYRYCRRRGLQDCDASDVAQNVLTIGCRSLRKFEYDSSRGRFRNWLRTVTERAICRFKRQKARPGQGYGGDDGRAFIEIMDGEAEAEWSQEFNTQVLRSAVNRVRPEFAADIWQAFADVWLKDRAPAAVAERLGRTTGWVYKAKFQVLRRLEQEILYLAADAGLYQK